MLQLQKAVASFVYLLCYMVLAVNLCPLRVFGEESFWGCVYIGITTNKAQSLSFSDTPDLDLGANVFFQEQLYVAHLKPTLPKRFWVLFP